MSPSASSPDKILLAPPILLVGHRGVGKSTLGRLAASQLGRPFFDLDDVIAEQSGTTIADLVARDIESFRTTEARTARTLVEHHNAPIIASGAGLNAFPPGAIIVWIHRDGWQPTVATSARPRVRPELSLDDEHRWMIDTREPRWREAAHLKLNIPRTRSVDRAADDLATLINWVSQVPHSPLAPLTTLVPLTPDDLSRALHDRALLGLGRVEVRSDRFPTLPAPTDLLDLNQHPTELLLSLRHPEPRWLLNIPRVAAWDIDLRFLTNTLHSADALRPHLPPTIILSAHPDRPAPTDLDALLDAAAALATALAIDPERITLKYAPQAPDAASILAALNTRATFDAGPHPFAIIPQGPRAAWTRHLLAATNHLHYLPTGLAERNPTHPSALDLQNFLPALTSPTPTRFDALIGDPVAQSQGDLWHRRAALRYESHSDEQHLGYLKVPTPADDLPASLSLLHHLNIRGISVTSPLKRHVAHHIGASAEALNTLRRTPDGWIGTDTDHVGMRASLQALIDAGITPGPTLIFGQGGVSPALLHALEDSNFQLIAHLSARAGWKSAPDNLPPLSLIINAAASFALKAPGSPPPAQAWLDLHYANVQPPPSGHVHLGGDTFFDAQALAQRIFWRS
ncbi:hypothetical protein FRC98_04405 [Lujinxingia vulgaris]|uniref:Uncharacterized protein n=1 Tax=Lujinxingia vulgaris TaxID=2600176 RepID=A0A5C6X9U9_9DELT|nr:shikimate kinase [Lujinxingia vulgaris]TXD38146.1 hypothetical protein FRC98_04405 [Lujinxingia vulgaris]